MKKTKFVLKHLWLQSRPAALYHFNSNRTITKTSLCLLWLRDTDVIKILEEQPSMCRVNCWENKMNKMNEKEGIFNQTCDRHPACVRKYELTAVHTSISKAAFGVHILVVWWGQDSTAGTMQHLYLLWAALVHGCPAGYATGRGQSPQMSPSAGAPPSPRLFPALWLCCQSKQFKSHKRKWNSRSSRKR